jgi:hypothetical protein
MVKPDAFWIRTFELVRGICILSTGSLQLDGGLLYINFLSGEAGAANVRFRFFLKLFLAVSDYAYLQKMPSSLRRMTLPLAFPMDNGKVPIVGNGIVKWKCLIYYKIHNGEMMCPREMNEL